MKFINLDEAYKEFADSLRNVGIQTENEDGYRPLIDILTDLAKLFEKEEQP